MSYAPTRVLVFTVLDTFMAPGSRWIMAAAERRGPGARGVP